MILFGVAADFSAFVLILLHVLPFGVLGAICLHFALHLFCICLHL